VKDLATSGICAEGLRSLGLFPASRGAVVAAGSLAVASPPRRASHARFVVVAPFAGAEGAATKPAATDPGRAKSPSAALRLAERLPISVLGSLASLPNSP
jgi:hypothetical protein